MQIINLGNTTQFDSPSWNGNGFDEPAPQSLWLRMPLALRVIAIREQESGNSITSILENREREIVLLSFGRRPVVMRTSDRLIVVHLSHRLGNYCYEGTHATYEHVESGCFLAFDDQNRLDEP